MARYMRVIVFFDLPSVTKADKKEYLNFRKFLINSGFQMMQESVYIKLTLNTTSADVVIKQIKSNKPKKGLVQAMIITEKQYSRIENIVGEIEKEVLDTGDRLVII